MRGLILPLCLLLGACETGDPAADAMCEDGGETYVFLMSNMGFVRAEDGLSEGFDLDGRVSDGYDDQGCDIEDYTSPDGTPGIDNAMARLLPVLDLTEAVAVEGLIADAIAAGELLIAVELSGVDDPLNDPCVNLTVARGAGSPLVGTDGVLLPGQTIARDTEKPESVVTQVALVDGRVEASPVTLEIPFNVFDIALNVVLDQGALDITLAEDGTATGYFAGGVTLASIQEVTHNNPVDAALVATLDVLLADNADLAPDDDGACSQLSITFQYEALPVWFYEGDQ